MFKDEDFAFAPEDVSFLEAVLDSRRACVPEQSTDRRTTSTGLVSSAPAVFLAGAGNRQPPTTESLEATPSLAPTLFQLAFSNGLLAANEQPAAPSPAFLAVETGVAQSVWAPSRSLDNLTASLLCSVGLAPPAQLSSPAATGRHSLPQTQPFAVNQPSTFRPDQALGAPPTRAVHQAVSAPERVLPWPWNQGTLSRSASVPLLPEPWQQQQKQQQQQFWMHASVHPVQGPQTTLGSLGGDMVLDGDLIAEIEAAPWPNFLTSLSGGTSGSLALPRRPRTPAACSPIAAVLGDAGASNPTAQMVPKPEPTLQATARGSGPSTSSAASSGTLHQAGTSLRSMMYSPIPTQEELVARGLQQPQWLRAGQPCQLHPRPPGEQTAWGEPAPPRLPDWPAPTAVAHLSGCPPQAAYPGGASTLAPGGSNSSTPQEAPCMGLGPGLEQASALPTNAVGPLQQHHIGAPSAPWRQLPGLELPTLRQAAEMLPAGGEALGGEDPAAGQARSGAITADDRGLAMAGALPMEMRMSDYGLTPFDAAAAETARASAPRVSTPSVPDGGGVDSGVGGSSGSAGAGRSRCNVTLEGLRAMFELPAQEVVRALGISATDLKRRCRALGIRRWPQRKLVSLKRLAEAVAEDNELSAEERQMVLDQVADNRSRILQEPDTELDSQLKYLRQVQYKRLFIERHGVGF